jgi:hypothetical protein
VVASRILDYVYYIQTLTGHIRDFFAAEQ